MLSSRCVHRHLKPTQNRDDISTSTPKPLSSVPSKPCHPALNFLHKKHMLASCLSPNRSPQHPLHPPLPNLVHPSPTHPPHTLKHIVLPEHESYTTYRFPRDSEIEQQHEAEFKRRTARRTAVKQLALIFFAYSACFWGVWIGGACILSSFSRDPDRLWVRVGENSKWAAGVWGFVAVVGMMYGGVLARREGMRTVGSRV